MRLTKVRVKRYRSINDLIIEFKQDEPVIVCGANNVGKTNFLRALELFFNMNPELFDASLDIPYDIEKGSRGGRYNTIITVWFQNDKDGYEISQTYKKEKDKGNTLTIKGKKNKQLLSNEESQKIIQNFRYIFVQASNIDMPKIIAEIIDEEVLPLGLDRLRKSQTVPLQKLQDFIDSSATAIKKIEEGIEAHLNAFIIDVPGIDNKDWKIKIIFSEFDLLRDAIKGIINFTLYDRNKTKMESKGSGIQRIVFLSILKYISTKTKKKIIWGIDEPEAFLQPTLQRKVFNILRDISKNQSLIITTHSQHFIDVNKLGGTYLFEAKYEKKEYARKKGEEFYKIATYISKDVGEFEKSQKIKKHLGIMRNDNWELMKYNILVEGEEDKKYIETLMDKFGFEKPHILVAGGATKIKGYLQYLADFCKESKFKPKILCLLDHDEAGKNEFQSLNTKKYSYFDFEVRYIANCCSITQNSALYEGEDLIYPDIIRKATNSFLKSRGYNAIKNTDFKKRQDPAYVNGCILSFLTQIVKNLNSDKAPLDFEDNNSGAKKTICEKACKIILQEDISRYDSKYPGVRQFISSICGE